MMVYRFITWSDWYMISYSLKDSFQIYRGFKGDYYENGDQLQSPLDIDNFAFMETQKYV